MSIIAKEETAKTLQPNSLLMWMLQKTLEIHRQVVLGWISFHCPVYYMCSLQRRNSLAVIS